MLQEINNFMNSLPAELKQAGLKPKEGLHVLLKIQEKEGTHFMDEQSVCRVCLTRKRQNSIILFYSIVLSWLRWDGV